MNDRLTTIASYCWTSRKSMVMEEKGNARRLAIWWNPYEVQSQNWLSTSNTLTSEFHYISTKEYVYLTIVYGPSSGGNKLISLQQLVNIIDLVEDSLRIFDGDFNLIISTQEKKGGVRRIDQTSIAFDLVCNNWSS